MSKFVPDPTLETQLTAEHAAGLALIGQTVKAKAEAIAPRHTGDYADSFIVTESPRRVSVGNTDFAAHLVEWGSANNPPYGVLRRAVKAAGLRFVEEGR